MVFLINRNLNSISPFMYAAVNSNQASSRSSVAWIVLIRFFHIMTSSYASIHGIQITNFLLNKYGLSFQILTGNNFLVVGTIFAPKKNQNLKNPAKKGIKLKRKCFEIIHLVQNMTTMKVLHRNKSNTSCGTVVMGIRFDVCEWLQSL